MMHADRCAVHHGRVHVVRVGDGRHDPVPVTRMAPAVEAIADRRGRAVPAGQTGPRGARAQHAEDAVDHPAVIDAFLAADLVWQHCLDDVPLRIVHV